MIATISVDGELILKDQSEDQKLDDPQVYELVQDAMRAGLTDFTTPTSADGEGRIDWSTRRWVVRRDGKLVCFMVAYRVLNAHYEIVGPEIPLPTTILKPAVRETGDGKK